MCHDVKEVILTTSNKAKYFTNCERKHFLLEVVTTLNSLLEAKTPFK